MAGGQRFGTGQQLDALGQLTRVDGAVGDLAQYRVGVGQLVALAKLTAGQLHPAQTPYSSLPQPPCGHSPAAEIRGTGVGRSLVPGSRSVL